ncbi:MAG: thiamine-phosphate kinase [Actinomycetota bacterium]|nr:thiamine-phosphate kinase [Actinomycetota bacterium]
MNPDEKVSQLGEFGLIDRIVARLGSPSEGELWSGDDAAVLRSPGEPLVFTTDVMVEDVDFDLDLCEGADIGFKAVAANASDVAAMGGRPRHLVAALTLTGSTSVRVVDGIADGIADACERWRIDAVGGDVSEGKSLSLAVAMTGSVPARPVFRGGAVPGDRLCVTGSLGGAAGGLRALRAGLRGISPEGDRLVARQLRPAARVGEGLQLAAAGANAMIDVSDGLLADLAHLLDASSVGCEVDVTAVPIDPDLNWLENRLEIDAAALALSGGEDFELLCAIPEGALDDAKSALDQLGTPLTDLGVVSEGDRVVGPRRLEEWKTTGWEHLRPR